MSEQAQTVMPVEPATSRVLGPGQTYSSVTEKIGGIVLTPLRRTPRGWLGGFTIAFLGVMVFLGAVTWLFIRGVGIWGINVPVAWAFAIINFVWWIGIGHAGTLISAILLLFKQQWRTSINRLAEAMTLFAVANATLFPLLHLGRPVYLYWFIPYPTHMGVWPQFRSPLIWDFFAVSTYGTVSLLFWYLGLLPDLASLRDRAQNKIVRVIYGILAMGWRNSGRHWFNFKKVYYLMAAIATPLVVSVHSVVSFDFAVSTAPGWHSTVFPPYFVAGAIFSGFAMVLTIMIPLRKFYRLQNMVTLKHLENMGKVMLAAGMIVGYGYMIEFFTAWYSGNIYEQTAFIARATGAYAPWFWLMLLCNVFIPQLIWFRRIRTNPLALWVIAIFVNVGMWLERFVIVAGSLASNFLPSMWQTYSPTIWDIATFVGTLGLFSALIFGFIRVLPMISIFEMRELVTQAKEGKA